MKWTIRLEARTEWGEATSYEIGALRRGIDDLTADGTGLTLREAKVLLAELQRRIVQSQIDEYIACARVAPRPITLACATACTVLRVSLRQLKRLPCRRPWTLVGRATRRKSSS